MKITKRQLRKLIEQTRRGQQLDLSREASKTFAGASSADAWRPQANFMPAGDEWEEALGYDEGYQDGWDGEPQAAGNVEYVDGWDEGDRDRRSGGSAGFDDRDY